MSLRRLSLRTVSVQAGVSEPFMYDIVERDALDAVLIILCAKNQDDQDDPWVCLRSALRPPVGLRPSHPAMLWELPAGLIERADLIDETASRETREETGFALEASSFERLGEPVYLSPGMCGEMLHFRLAWVDRSAARELTSTEQVEQLSEIEWVLVSESLRRAAAGSLRDCKTELALHRLRARLDAAQRQAKLLMKDAK